MLSHFLPVAMQRPLSQANCNELQASFTLEACGMICVEVGETLSDTEGGVDKLRGASRLDEEDNHGVLWFN